MVTYAYVKNHLGSIRFVVDASTGTVAQQLDYDAWGNVLSDSSPGFQPFAFAGGIYDRDTKLTHFGYRDYDASAGVWTAKDPIRLRGGLNALAYAGADPMSHLDSSGLDYLVFNGSKLSYVFEDPATGIIVSSREWDAKSGHDYDGVSPDRIPNGEYRLELGLKVEVQRMQREPHGLVDLRGEFIKLHQHD